MRIFQRIMVTAACGALLAMLVVPFGVLAALYVAVLVGIGTAVGLMGHSAAVAVRNRSLAKVPIRRQHRVPKIV